MSKHLQKAKVDYLNMHKALCSMIERSSLEVLLEEHGWKKDSHLLAIKLAQHLHTLHGTTAMTALNH